VDEVLIEVNYEYPKARFSPPPEIPPDQGEFPSSGRVGDEILPTVERKKGHPFADQLQQTGSSALHPLERPTLMESGLEHTPALATVLRVRTRPRALGI